MMFFPIYNAQEVDMYHS